MVLVQGDTTTALAGALAAFHRRIPVAHVEAGLRSGDRDSPYPEEMNRRVIGSLASLHLAATAHNQATLIAEHVPEDAIAVTGNPVVDALHAIRALPSSSAAIEQVIDATAGLRRIVLTTHRRESFGTYMGESLAIIRQFVENHDDVALIFPVHPNPVVVETTRRVLGTHPRIHLLAPLDYSEFVHLLAQAWLIVSDSGGVQEEAPTIGKPLIILRENTERPEAVTCGIARLVGPEPGRLAQMLNEARNPDSWVARAATVVNPFGTGNAGLKIVEAIDRYLVDVHAPLAVTS
jgi:UDP-N-acetylglucosamine 2-epimerase (non-hydrolysing)